MFALRARFIKGTEGAEAAKAAKGKFYLSKRRSLLTVTNYSLLITNYFCPFRPLRPLRPFNVVVAWNKRNQQEQTGQHDPISCQKGSDLALTRKLADGTY